MANKVKKNKHKNELKANIFSALHIVIGIAACIWAIALKPESKNAFWAGLSGRQFLMIGLVIMNVVFSVVWSNKIGRKLYYLAAFYLIITTELLVFAQFPTDSSQNLIPVIVRRMTPLIVYLILCSLLWLLSLRMRGFHAPRELPFFCLLVSTIGYYLVSTYIDRYNWALSLKENQNLCLALLFSAGVWFWTLKTETERWMKIAAGAFFFCVFGFVVTRLTGLWMGRSVTPSKAYWNELAEAFLNNRLYLINPSGKHDLTQYKGNWFVPNPPLPGILLVPVVALLGSAEAVNMTVYSNIVTGINAGLTFLFISLLFLKKGNPLFVETDDNKNYPKNSLSIAVWVTAVFTFGTDMLWLGTTGQMWFISQLLTVTFTLLACILVVCGVSPVWVGTSLGAAILSRPNIFPVFLFLAGLYLSKEHSFPKIDVKKMLLWCIKCGIPVCVSAGLLLLYNYLRFDDFLDFGYTTINGADWILDSVQAYGMFHPHFFKTNADVMLFGLPRIDLSGKRFFFYPHVAGYSIFIMTPPFVYLFRSFKKNWVSICAWTSVVITVIFLLFYHNTGAEQIGYRYILDATAPLVFLLADGMKGKTSAMFKILAVLSFIISVLGIYWWYLGRV